MNTNTTIPITHAHTSNDNRAERELGAVVGPWVAESIQHRRSDLPGSVAVVVRVGPVYLLYCVIGTHWLEMILRAAADDSIQPMNADAAPVALPLVTS